MPRYLFAAVMACALFTLPSIASAAPAPAPAPTAAMQTIPPIRYQVLKSGDPAGPHPSRKDTVRINYEVKLPDGTIIDSSFQRGQPDEFQLSKLIPGWQVAVPLMRPGDEWRILIPAEYAYGEKGRDGVPGGAELEFRIELIAIVPTKPEPQ